MIDSHHHIWRQQDLPWLTGPEQPRIFGEYGAIRRDYLIDEYLKDIADTGIRKSVYVQANWGVDCALDEAAWVQSVAEESGWPHAIVAYADFTVEDVEPQLQRLSQYKQIRGIRQQLHWHQNPQYCFAKKTDIASNTSYQRNIAKLTAYDWCFDLQVFPGQVESAIALARACPDVQFILQHAGMLEDTSAQGWEQWCDALQLYAECENIHVKLSGLGTFVHRLDISLIEKIVAETVRTFGPQRCLYGSNFPIEKLWTSYDELFTALKTVVSGIGEQHVQAIFNDNAERLYRL